MVEVAASLIIAGAAYYQSDKAQKDAKSARKDDKKERLALEAELASKERVAREGEQNAENRRRQQQAASGGDTGTTLAGSTDAGYTQELGG